MEANERFDRTIRGGIRWERLTRQRMEHELCLEQYGYKTYSQNDEDGSNEDRRSLGIAIYIDKIYKIIGCCGIKEQ